MEKVRRIYVEKKEPFAVKAKELHEDLKSYLGMEGVEKVRELIRYDVENISDETFEKACHSVFAEPPVDDLYREELPLQEYSVWNFYPDSLIREPIQRYSVCAS